MKKIFTIIFLFSVQVFAQPYPEPTSDIPWSGSASTVADIKAAFENGRSVENSQLLTSISTTLVMPTQVVWDAMSNSEKGLYLINAERVVRGLLPLEAVHPKVETVAQNYADLLRTNNAFQHDFGGTSSISRLNVDPDINGCSELGFQWGPENLYASANSAPSTFPLALEKAVYIWIYDDGSSAWGHRNACFAPFNNNYGSPSSEGFIGFGVSSGDYTYFSTSFPYGIVIVYNFVDPCATSALPVELTTFNVIISEDNIVQLSWETATEINNYGFEVERHASSSLRMTNNYIPNEDEGWEKVAFVEGHGNSNSPKYYTYLDKLIEASGTYLYRLKQVDIDGTFEYSDEVEVTIGTPNNFELSQNYPNPFNPTTLISYSIPNDGQVTLAIYDILGNEVAVLENSYKSAGNYTYNFDATNLSSGLYFYTIRSGKSVETKKMLLMK